MTNESLAKALATEALRDARITSPPVDLDDLAHARALRIDRNADLGAGIRAVYRPEDGLIRVVSLPPRVERFPVAHELGHAILGDAGRACTTAMIKEQADAVSLAEALESFNPESVASAIASQLLVPSPWLRSAVAAGRTMSDLQEVFDVTRPVVMIAILRDRLLTKVRAD